MQLTGLLNFGLVLYFLPVTNSVSFIDCGSHSVATRSVKISRCHIDPCVLFVGESVTIEVTFLAKADIVPGLFRLQSIIGGKVSDKIFVDDAVCSRFSPMCPIRSGGTYTYRFKGVVKRGASDKLINGRLELTNPKGIVFLCANFGMRILESNAHL
ncbi:hypothetical protein CSKR_108481 [Clonorchis sinensis]|uniref:MD-2-related lipid-recognition domain-containing protein n=1 Tax=Clonorchis sinensis TaxID=79923 RepID=A0A8T1MWL9_CLOSI|nr:hypothetical protein CSKR_108481 [Clonorchis sinensis]